MNTTRIVKSINQELFQSIVLNHELAFGPHALDHLSDAQRKVFIEEELFRVLKKERPRGVGLQRNGRFAVFYRRKRGYMKVIVGLRESKLEIITFMNVDNMPNLKRLK